MASERPTQGGQGEAVCTNEEGTKTLGCGQVVALAFVGIILLVGVGTCLLPGGKSERTLSPDAPKVRAFARHKQTLEYKLAVIDGVWGASEENNVTVARFRTLLRLLSSKYVENRQQIADMTVKAQELLRKDGVAESLLNIMEGLNTVMRIQVGNQRYAEYAAAYTALRSGGMAHQEAVDGLQALIESIARQPSTADETSATNLKPSSETKEAPKPEATAKTSDQPRNGKAKVLTFSEQWIPADYDRQKREFFPVSWDNFSVRRQGDIYWIRCDKAQHRACRLMSPFDCEYFHLRCRLMNTKVLWNVHPTKDSHAEAKGPDGKAYRAPDRWVEWEVTRTPSGTRVLIDGKPHEVRIFRGAKGRRLSLPIRRGTEIGISDVEISIEDSGTLP